MNRFLVGKIKILHNYGNMQGKRKLRELYLCSSMVSQIAVDSKTQIKEILYYIYVVCIPCLYKNEVI